MPEKLLQLAERLNISIIFWDFKPPLDAVYWCRPGLPPYIGIAKRVCENRTYFRCILAEEIGHHKYTVGQMITKTSYRYGDRLRVSKEEYRAMRWAAQYLIPKDELLQALRNGLSVGELEEHFDVTTEMMEFRLQLTDVQEKLFRFTREGRLYIAN